MMWNTVTSGPTMALKGQAFASSFCKLSHASYAIVSMQVS